MKRALLLLIALLILSSMTACQSQKVIDTLPPDSSIRVLPSESSGSTSPTRDTEPTAPPLTEPPAPTLPADPLFTGRQDSDFVLVSDYIPDLPCALQYASVNNYASKSIYSFRDAYLRYGTVKKLIQVQQELKARGMSLKLLDAFRPVSAQHKLWQALPDSRYIADPKDGWDVRCQGSAVSVTLVGADGETAEMPSRFDDRSRQADRDYSDCSETAAENAVLLENVMKKHGFTGSDRQWWSFCDTDPYPVETCFDPSLISRWQVNCTDLLNLKGAPENDSEILAEIADREQVLLLGYAGEDALVDWNGKQGYLPVLNLQMSAAAMPERWTVNTEEYVNLRDAPGSGNILVSIPAGETVEYRSCMGKHTEVYYNGYRGYVMSSYLKPENEHYFEEALPVVDAVRCYSYDQMAEDLKILHEKYPDITELEWIGSSELGREIPVIRIGNPGARFHIMIQGGIHGLEHMTAWLLSAMTDYWLDNDIWRYGDICYHIIPMSNPDGVMISQSGTLNEAQHEIYLRDLSRGYTWLDEETYASEWKANGLGVDINRNFASGWEQSLERPVPSSQQYRGEAPFDSAEARILRDYTLRYPFDVTISYHAYGSVIYYEYGPKQPVNDLSYSLGVAVNNVSGYYLIGGYGVIGAGYKDWAIDDLEIPSLTIEIGSEDTPLAQRELYSVFARNVGVLPAIAEWLITGAEA